MNFSMSRSRNFTVHIHAFGGRIYGHVRFGSSYCMSCDFHFPGKGSRNPCHSSIICVSLFLSIMLHKYLSLPLLRLKFVRFRNWIGNYWWLQGLVSNKSIQGVISPILGVLLGLLESSIEDFGYLLRKSSVPIVHIWKMTWGLII